MDNKVNVGIIFGGKSAEHEVSVKSAKNVYDAMDKNKYNVVMIGIAKDGKWVLNPDTLSGVVSINDGNDTLNKLLALIPGSDGSQFVQLDGKKDIERLDVVFPILHGPFGEDGTMQGLLKLMNIPFVGPGVMGSAAGMDKEVMKRLLRDSNLPYAKYLVLEKYTGDVPNPTYDEIKEYLGAPFFVKPSSMGSSVGISKVSTADEYEVAVNEAFKFDNKLIVEKNIKGREIECSVLGNEKPIASLPGEICSSHSFYTYEAKYLDEQGAVLKIPAQLPDGIVKRIQETAVKTFKALYCEGMTRVDMFLTDENEIIINEVNTIPGFTNISMYPKLWGASGISYSELIDRLIEYAMQRYDREMQLKTSI